MKHLFSPWRSAYIGQKQPKGCFLCRSARQKDDAANLILYRGPKVFIIMNRYPYNNGHLMITPYRHIADITRLTPTEARGLFAQLQRAVRVLRKELKPDAFNIGMNLGRVAGAGLVGHLHLHIVPRWNGDTNFMPVSAETRVVSEALDTTWRRLSRWFARR
jgi:ATP adenylyltransferase